MPLHMNGVRRGKGIRTTVRAKDGHRAGDLLNRDFTAPAPNTFWVADFIYCRSGRVRLRRFHRRRHLELQGIAPSIGTVGDASDNGLMESIIGLFKTECIATTVFRDGPRKTITDTEYTAGCVDWSPLGVGRLLPVGGAHAHCQLRRLVPWSTAALAS